MSLRVGRTRQPDEALVSRFIGLTVIGVQRGTITLAGAAITNTATIVAVNTANSVLRYLGSTFTAAAANESEAFARISLTNTTTVTADRITGANTVVVSFEVIEYAPGVIKLVQRGTVVANATTAITSVNTVKAECTALGFTNDIDGDLRCLPYVTLNNATTVGATAVLGDGSTPVVGFQVVEFF